MKLLLQVSNNGNKPALVQAWIDEGDAKSTPDQSQAPFMITPPISRVDGNKGQTLRISALPKSGGLSKTQETLYWLNILDIPPKPSAKILMMFQKTFCNWQFVHVLNSFIDQPKLKKIRL